MKEWLKRTKANIILVALLTMILGLVLILWPTSSTMFICLLSGWLLLLGGILSIILYFSAPQTGPNAGLFLGLVGAGAVDSHPSRHGRAVFECALRYYPTHPRILECAGQH